MTRLRRSRPRSSVPNRCEGEAERSLSSGAIRSGSYGATAFPASAMLSRTTTMAPPIHAPGMRPSRRSDRARKLVPATATAASVPDARVHDSIRHVHGEVDDDIDGGEEQRRPHDGRVIERQDAFHPVKAHPGPGKAELDHEHAPN